MTPWAREMQGAFTHKKSANVSAKHTMLLVIDKVSFVNITVGANNASKSVGKSVNQLAFKGVPIRQHNLDLARPLD